MNIKVFISPPKTPTQRKHPPLCFHALMTDTMLFLPFFSFPFILQPPQLLYKTCSRGLMSVLLDMSRNKLATPSILSATTVGCTGCMCFILRLKKNRPIRTNAKNKYEVLDRPINCYLYHAHIYTLPFLPLHISS